MGEKDDDGLGLSLSLSLPNMVSLPPQPMQHQNHKSAWTQLFQFSDVNSKICKDETRVMCLQGIDVNRVPPPPQTTAEGCGDEEVGVSSPNSTVSSISGKRSEREETRPERASTCRGICDEDDGDGGEDGARKKLRLSKDQAAVLEETFKEHNTLNPKQKLALAKQLNLRARQVEVWFQNRRARTKLKQTEVDCEYLKRCCEDLTEENRRLQKEVQELRALKLNPRLHMHMTPPTTLTMCPSCERVAVSSSSSSSAAASSALAPTVVRNLHRRHLVGPPHHHRPIPIRSWTPTPMHHQPLDAQGPRL